MLHSRWGRAAETRDPRVSDIVAGTIGIDAHNHVGVPLTSNELPGPDINIAGEMKSSGLSAICATFVTDREPGDAYDRFLKRLAYMDRQLDRDGIKRSLTPSDIRASHAKGQPAVIQSMAGGQFLDGHLD